MVVAVYGTGLNQHDRNGLKKLKEMMDDFAFKNNGDPGVADNSGLHFHCAGLQPGFCSE
jgi:hypothetical protein